MIWVVVSPFPFECNFRFQLFVFGGVRQLNGVFFSNSEVVLVSLREGIRGMMIGTIVVVNHQDGRINAVQLHGALQLGDLGFFFPTKFFKGDLRKTGQKT